MEPEGSVPEASRGGHFFTTRHSSLEDLRLNAGWIGGKCGWIGGRCNPSDQGPDWGHCSVSSTESTCAFSRLERYHHPRHRARPEAGVAVARTGSSMQLSRIQASAPRPVESWRDPRRVWSRVGRGGWVPGEQHNVHPAPDLGAAVPANRSSRPQRPRREGMAWSPRQTYSGYALALGSSWLPARLLPGGPATTRTGDDVRAADIDVHVGSEMH